uniref:Chitin-binding type-2 domain-containing protein n=1 Tax=Graphocephala atropunctata TaxID=36148 RepID=A0A1B6MDL5_9HEMI
MVSLQVLIFSASVSVVFSGQVGVMNLSQDLITDPKLLALLSPSEPCLVNYSCLNCTAVRICAPTESSQALKEINRFNCPVGTWCDPLSATCSAQQPQSCMVPADFTCMRDGYFPDLNECSNYFYCHRRNSFVFKCAAPNRFYNPFTETCSSSNYCVSKTICDKKTGVKVKIHGNNKQQFAYCSNNAVSSIDSCVGAYVFNEKTQVCDQTCPHAGLFPDADDCRRYYRCDPTYKTSSVYKMTELTCPEGEAFSQSAYQCVNHTLVTDLLEDGTACHVL